MNFNPGSLLFVYLLSLCYLSASHTYFSCIMFFFLMKVNASGQFCGVAEMVGTVDFNKNMDFWQQDKWNGSFPVKWHFIKDVPNPNFRHIILENNENKPVTNSRDTQEVCIVFPCISFNKFRHGRLFY